MNRIIKWLKEKWYRLKKELRENWPKYVIEGFFVLVLGLFVFFIQLQVTDSLKPQTDISVECKITKGVNANYSLDIYFDNKADFAGKQFYTYVWGVTSNNFASKFSFSEHCKHIVESEIDAERRLKTFCDFIPPKTKWSYSINTNLNEEIIRTNRIKIEWWGETTPHKKEFIICK